MKRLHKEHDTYPAIFCLGLITTADSLAAIQKLVFDEQKYTMDELLVALNEDWEGYEAMHQDFLNAPKYGNDDDYADARREVGRPASKTRSARSRTPGDTD